MSFYKEVPGRKTTLESTLKFDTTAYKPYVSAITSNKLSEKIIKELPV